MLNEITAHKMEAHQNGGKTKWRKRFRKNANDC